MPQLVETQELFERAFRPLNNAAAIRLAASQQAVARAEAERDRERQLDDVAAQRAFLTGERVGGQDFQRELQQNQQAFSRDEADHVFGQRLDAAGYEAGLRQKEAEGNRTFQLDQERERRVQNRADARFEDDLTRAREADREGRSDKRRKESLANLAGAYRQAATQVAESGRTFLQIVAEAQKTLPDVDKRAKAGILTDPTVLSGLKPDLINLLRQSPDSLPDILANLAANKRAEEAGILAMAYQSQLERLSAAGVGGQVSADAAAALQIASQTYLNKAQEAHDLRGQYLQGGGDPVALGEDPQVLDEATRRSVFGGSGDPATNPGTFDDMGQGQPAESDLESGELPAPGPKERLSETLRKYDARSLPEALAEIDQRLRQKEAAFAKARDELASGVRRTTKAVSAGPGAPGISTSQTVELSGDQLSEIRTRAKSLNKEIEVLKEDRKSLSRERDAVPAPTPVPTPTPTPAPSPGPARGTFDPYATERANLRAILANPPVPPGYPEFRAPRGPAGPPIDPRILLQ